MIEIANITAHAGMNNATVSMAVNTLKKQKDVKYAKVFVSMIIIIFAIIVEGVYQVNNCECGKPGVLTAESSGGKVYLCPDCVDIDLEGVPLEDAVEPPKPNNCWIEFDCNGSIDCVYSCNELKEGIIKCKHNKDDMCNSTIAQVNAIVIKLKEVGLDFGGDE